MTREVAQSISDIESTEKRPEDVNKTLNAQIDAKLEEKSKLHLEAKREAKEVEKAEKKEANKNKPKAAFVVEQDETGLYFVTLNGSGTLPDKLKGQRYTNKFYLERDLEEVQRNAKGEKRETIFKS